MKSIDTVQIIHNVLGLKGYEDAQYSINGVVLDYEFTKDVIKTLGYFLNFPTDRFEISIRHPGFSIEFNRASSRGGVICKATPFGCFATTVVQPMLDQFKKFTPKYHNESLSSVLGIFYGSIQYAVLPGLKSMIKQQRLSSVWAALIMSQPDYTPLTLAEFHRAFSHINEQDLRILTRHCKEQQLIGHRLLQVIQQLQALAPLQYREGKLPYLVNEHFNPVRIKGNRRQFQPPNTLEGMLPNGSFTYDAFAEEHNNQLSLDRLALAPEQLGLSMEQFAFIEKTIGQQGNNEHNIEQRLALLQHEWRKLKDSAMISKSS